MSDWLYYSAKKLGSFLVLLSFLLGTEGCLKSRLQNQTAPLIFTQQLIHNYGSISGPPFDEYVSYLTRRLTAAFPASPALSVLLINTPHVYAASLSNGTVILSKGLILKLGNEAELAFIVAHELSHLRHLRQGLEKTSADNRPHFLRPSAEEELAADREALGIIALAGYDPRAALAALNKTHQLGLDSKLPGATSVLKSSPDYPALEERTRAALQYIQASNWRPPGITDRRDFQKLKEALRKLS